MRYINRLFTYLLTYLLAYLLAYLLISFLLITIYRTSMEQASNHMVGKFY